MYRRKNPLILHTIISVVFETLLIKKMKIFEVLGKNFQMLEDEPQNLNYRTQPRNNSVCIIFEFYF